MSSTFGNGWTVSLLFWDRGQTEMEQIGVLSPGQRVPETIDSPTPDELAAVMYWTASRTEPGWTDALRERFAAGEWRNV